MTVTELRKTPLMAQVIQKTDTDAVLKTALKIAEEHRWVKVGSKSLPRFVTFLTDAEMTPGKAFLVPQNSWYEVLRFHRALERARQEYNADKRTSANQS